MNENRNIEFIVHRILSGRYIFSYNDKIYELRKPSLDLKLRADMLYQQTYQDNLFNNFWLQEDIDSLLFELKFLSYNYKENISKIEKHLDNAKVNLYQQFFDTTSRPKNRKRIDNIRADLNQILSNKHALDFLTLEYYCDNIKHEFIILNSLYYYDTNKLVFDSDNIEYLFFNNLVSYISSNIIDIVMYKKIARSDYWKNYWNNNKTSVIKEPISEWSEEQKSLINISCMYDKIYEHPECPKEDIINDDDALDGWMIYQKQENERKKKEKGVDDMLTGKIRNASEVFLMAGNKDQAQDILGLNSDKSLSAIKQKVDYVMSSKGPVRDAQLPDVKQKLREQIDAQNKG